jgi:hypothetical protein
MGMGVMATAAEAGVTVTGTAMGMEKVRAK